MKRNHWISLIVVGIAYGFVGIVLTELSKRFATDQARFWRLAAWILSAVVFAVHIGFEQFRLKQRSLQVALHAAIAVAVGAFLLAAAAIIHAAMVPVHAPFWLFAIALVAWPAFTAVPAFVAALIASAVLSRIRRINTFATR